LAAAANARLKEAQQQLREDHDRHLTDQVRCSEGCALRSCAGASCCRCCEPLSGTASCIWHARVVETV
jgi:hypothetical protein